MTEKDKEMEMIKDKELKKIDARLDELTTPCFLDINARNYMSKKQQCLDVMNPRTPLNNL